MTTDELPTHADLIKPRGTPTTAYQAVATAIDGSVTRGKLRLRVEATDADVAELVRKDPTATVRVISMRVYEQESPGASDAGERESMPTKKMIKAKPKKKIAQKPKRAKATNGAAGAALDLATLKGGSKIIGTFKGAKHTATIVHEGERLVVLYRGKQYKSLSGAARAVIVATDGEGSGARMNGRTFWRLA